MTPESDLGKNIITTIYLLYSHNYIAIAYFSGVIISIILSLWKPSRFTILCLLGFSILLFSFEYDKHLIVPFREQTLKSLITNQPHYKIQRIIELVISDIFPIFFYILGWLLIYTAIFFAAKEFNTQKNKKTR